MNPKVETLIKNAIEKNDVLLFMKGTREAPSCGFSARTIEVLESLMNEFSTVDVLAHPEIREGIKEFSSWPTIPQLYVKGEFVGGADIIGEMYESGELQKSLGLAPDDAEPPKITITPSAQEALQGYIADSNEVVLLEIDSDFQPGLSIGPAPQMAILSKDKDITIALDRLSATRADGLVIDFIDTKEGKAFKLNNPNEPGKVKDLTVSGLQGKMERQEKLRLIDVRRPDEWDKARIEGAELLDSSLAEQLAELSKDTLLVFQCHHGHRSARAAEQYVQQGFKEVYNLVGGIDAWSQEIDPKISRY